MLHKLGGDSTRMFEVKLVNNRHADAHENTENDDDKVDVQVLMHH